MPPNPTELQRIKEKTGGDEIKKGEPIKYTTPQIPTDGAFENDLRFKHLDFIVLGKYLEYIKENLA